MDSSATSRPRMGCAISPKITRTISTSSGGEGTRHPSTLDRPETIRLALVGVNPPPPPPSPIESESTYARYPSLVSHWQVPRNTHTLSRAFSRNLPETTPKIAPSPPFPRKREHVLGPVYILGGGGSMCLGYSVANINNNTVNKSRDFSSNISIMFVYLILITITLFIRKVYVSLITISHHIPPFREKPSSLYFKNSLRKYNPHSCPCNAVGIMLYSRMMKPASFAIKGTRC